MVKEYIKLEKRNNLLSGIYLAFFTLGVLSLLTVLLFVESEGIKIPFGISTISVSCLVMFFTLDRFFSKEYSFRTEKIEVKRE